MASSQASSSTSTSPLPTSSKSTTSTMKRRTRLIKAAVACAVTLSIFSNFEPVNAAMFEPPGNQVLYGAWFDPASGYSDTPTIFNQRLGQNVPVFQVAQLIPLPPYNYVTGVGGPPPTNLIELSGTDAAIFLTVYPSLGFAQVATTDFQLLGAQILEYQVKYNRTVFLRYAPEMQGLWNVYGQQPIEFVASWKTMYNYVKAIAPDTIMVWAPNTAQGYPYGQSFADTSAANIAALDTNNDGTVTGADDAYSPYYPGNGYVDWIGLSIYYKGQDPGQVLNEVQDPGYCHQVISGINPGTGANITAWYQEYCASKPDKACMFAECGAAYHVSDTTGATQAQLQQGWLKDCVTNISFLNTFPRLKLIMQFEYEKNETDNQSPPTQDLRDYRVTNVSSVAQELAADFVSMGDRFSWANARAPASTYSATASAGPTVNGDGETIIAIITATTRGRSQSFPALFGVTGGSQKKEFIELGVLVAAFVSGALAVMRYM